jgi:hypothetical protein
MNTTNQNEAARQQARHWSGQLGQVARNLGTPSPLKGIGQPGPVGFPPADPPGPSRTVAATAWARIPAGRSVNRVSYRGTPIHRRAC